MYLILSWLVQFPPSRYSFMGKAFKKQQKPMEMKEFALLFRFPDYDYSKASPKDFEALAKKWQDWAGNITAQGRMAGNGMRLAMEGKVLRAGGVITDGPLVEI